MAREIDSSTELIFFYISVYKENQSDKDGHQCKFVVPTTFKLSVLLEGYRKGRYGRL